MKRYILTGAPGSGKTTLLRALETRGLAVVEEAATDVHLLMRARGFDAPHLAPSFLADILALQLSRQRRADAWTDDAVLFDRSPVCTLALAQFLGVPPPAGLREELDRLRDRGVYERQVFFVETLGFIVNDDVRRISYADTLRFAAVHAEVYERLGYALVRIAAAGVDERAAGVLAAIRPPLQQPQRSAKPSTSLPSCS
jgi:predicted ATPase